MQECKTDKDYISSICEQYTSRTPGRNRAENRNAKTIATKSDILFHIIRADTVTVYWEFFLTVVV